MPIVVEHFTYLTDTGFTTADSFQSIRAHLWPLYATWLSVCDHLLDSTFNQAQLNALIAHGTVAI